jgi:VWFA-related protein
MTIFYRARLLVLGVVGLPLIALGQGASSTQPPGASQVSTAEMQEPPVFRSGVQLIEIDVRVTDRRGQVIQDLSQDDFEILEDGMPQEIRSFAFVDLPVMRADPLPRDVQAPEPDVTTNRTPEGRIYVILVDTDTIGRSIALVGRDILRQFVDEWIAPGDLVAVVHKSGTFSDAQPFTTNKRLVLAAIEREGRGVSGALGVTTGPETVARELSLYRVIEDLALRLGAINGRRKAILWLGGGIIFDPASRGCPADDGRPDPQGNCAIPRSAGNLLAAYRDAIGTANRHNVAIYPIDPNRLTTSTGRRALERTAGLRMVAQDTGGIAVVNTNNLRPAYEAIVRDNSSYYLLSYSPAIEHRDGRFHDVRVRVRRPGLTVRARRGYFAPRPDAPAAAPAALPEGFSVAARDALRLPVPVRGLGIDVYTAPFAMPDGIASVVIGGQVGGALRLDEGARVGVAYQVFDLEGRVTTGEYKIFDLALQPETRGRVEEAGLRFVDRLALPAGRYELRLAVDQPDGGVGSVVVPLEVPTFEDALAMSGILLGAASTAGDLTLHADAAAQAALGMDPTATRRFLSGDRVSGYAEVYARDRQLTGENVQLRAVVTTDAGAEVTREAGRQVPDDTPRASAWGFTFEVSLADVPPGSYVLTVEGRAGRRTVTRQVPFSVVD